MRCIRAFACAALAALAAACAGHGLAPGAPTFAAPAQRSATVRITVEIPKAARKRRARYISPSTQSMRIAFAPAKTGTTVEQTIDLTPTTGGCAPTPTGTLCARTLLLAPGRYTASVSTYDATNATGAVLSSGQNVPLDVITGRANRLAMTLDGIPHAISVAAVTPGLHGSQTSGFTLYGNTAQNFSVIATDADHNPIVGAGAPAFAVSVVSGSGWVAPTPAPATPNTLSVTPPATSGAVATIQIAATYADETCNATGAVCTSSISLLHHLQNVWVLDTGSSTIDEYAYPYTGGEPTVSIADAGGNIGGTNQNAQGFALDTQGDIFVANCSATCGRGAPDSVTEYAAPGYSSTATQTIASGIANPEALAIDSSGHLFVANQNGSVTEYASPYAGAPLTTITNGIRVPVGLAIDSNGNLYVLNCAVSCNDTSDADAILKYASPYTGSPLIVGTVSNPAAGAIAVDALGDVFAGATNGVTEYPAGSSTATTMAVAGVALSIALDGEAGVFAGGCATSCAVSSAPDSLLEYAPPYAAAKTIDASGGSTAFGHPAALAIDGAGNLIVANGNDNTLRIYAWPYTGAPHVSVGTLSGPTGLILTP